MSVDNVFWITLGILFLLLFCIRFFFAVFFPHKPTSVQFGGFWYSLKKERGEKLLEGTSWRKSQKMLKKKYISVQVKHPTRMCLVLLVCGWHHVHATLSMCFMPFMPSLFQTLLGPTIFNHANRLQVFQNYFCLFQLCVLSPIKYLTVLGYKWEMASSLDGNRRWSKESY